MLSIRGSFIFIILFVARLVLADASLDIMASKSVGDEDPAKTGLQSGRFQVRAIAEGDEIKKSVRTSFKKTGKKPASVEGEEHPAASVVATPPLTPAPAESENTPSAPVQEPTLSDQIADIFHGGAHHTSDLYREQIHQDDIRNNRVEIDFISGLNYTGSSANDSYRNYSSAAPLAQLATHFWLTPLVGMSANYQSTLGESISSATTGASTVSAKSEWLQLSLDFRKFYGMSRRANSMSWGLVFTEYKFNISPSETSRVGLRSDAWGLYLAGRFPTAPTYAWVFGGEIYPIDNHSEISSALAYSSGSSNNSYKVGMHIGGELKMNRQSQILWTLGATMEKNQFTGTANIVDPSTGQTPTGVSVLNTSTYFNLGYRWGQ